MPGVINEVGVGAKVGLGINRIAAALLRARRKAENEGKCLLQCTLADVHYEICLAPNLPATH